ncbi:MAG TPA: DNA topoisomerase IB [Lacunisphaera sp.]|nr:DNA topoisomerase IB [Lacunisphaera sp.]
MKQPPRAKPVRSRVRYVTRFAPGFSRLGAPGRFRYRTARGRAVRDSRTLARIRRLAIPPAWRDVWICGDPAGHLQAAGRDARGRWQYRYHEDWRAARDRSKFEHLLDFGRRLPAIRRRVARDLRGPPLARATVLAALVSLLESTLIRVGNEEYAQANHSYGLTTFRNRHVDVGRTTMRFHFRGKSGRWHEIERRDPRLAALLRRLQDLPGQDLFQFVGDDGHIHSITSGDVNDYLRAAAGADVTAKDFRTWAGTLSAARLLGSPELARWPKTKRRVADAAAEVARLLGNTPAIARQCYIHPRVVAAYLDGTLPVAFPAEKATSRRRIALSPAERALLRLLASK